MSARAVPPGAGSRVTEVRHTRPRRAWAAAASPASARRPLASARAGGGGFLPRPAAGGPGGHLRRGVRCLGRSGAGAARGAPERGRFGRLVVAHRSPRAAGFHVPLGFVGMEGEENAFWIASLDAAVRAFLCCLGVLFDPVSNDQKLEFLAFPTVRRSPSVGLAIRSWQFGLDW